jgi:2-methylcitrate dehydratase PrpD
MSTLIETFANFAAETRFEALPPEVVEESKRLLLDSLGCALAGLSHPKGTIAVDYARLQGPGALGNQASIIGTGERVSAIGAGFANGELINALDFDALLPPGHVSPYVIPGAFAVAEAMNASGKDLLCAIAIAHELSNRMGKGLDYLRDIKNGKISPPPVHGYSSTLFGATAAIGKIKGYSKKMIADAIGIAASMSPVNYQWSWSLHLPISTVKYTVAGALVQTAMTGASLAELGHTGDIQLLDDREHGWPKMIGSSRWAPEFVTPELGAKWLFPAQTTYKTHPHCGAEHPPIQVLSELVRDNDIKPSEIEHINAWVEGHVMHEVWLNRNIQHVTHGQHSIAHALSMAAHLMPADKSWPSPEAVFNPSVLALMDKIEFDVHPEYEKLLASDAASRPTRVEVRARGKTFVGEKRWPKGMPSPDPDTYMTNDELTTKFVRNAEGVLSERNVDLAANTIWELETVGDVCELIALFRP